MSDFWKRPGLFDEDRSGFAFREVFTPTREGPLPPRPKAHRSGVGGGPQTPVTPVTSVWSASDAAANGMTLSNGGLTVTPSGTGAWLSIRSSISKNSGKLYIEMSTSVVATSQNIIFGMADASFVSSDYLGDNGVSFGLVCAGWDAFKAGFVGHSDFGAVTPALNDVFAIAVDFTAGKVWMAQNNVWIASGNPATGVTPAVTIVAPAAGVLLFPAMSFNGVGAGVWTLQASAASQKYAPPAGFSPWG